MNYAQLKEDIKVLAAKQPEYKNQRKTVHRIGEEILYPYPEGSRMYEYYKKYNMKNTQSPIILHKENRHNLRLLYATQQLLKGKTFKEIESHNKESTFPLSYYQKQLDKLVEKYGEVAHTD